MKWEFNQRFVLYVCLSNLQGTLDWTADCTYEKKKMITFSFSENFGNIEVFLNIDWTKLVLFCF